ncbi:WD40 repeat domain-containing serine/threonine protein kinase [Nannocystis radixulma]|uniref:Serine/threonine-protein kinase n=1 Tax=Nannocystis radixulma TaxID=2995305 RepID=A0ABT5BFI7_9BACT|nr:serine/threonine-protein kinase [Nannocystis radixulma]MDC0672917.1 serine/threonine-protein kinase [Nannocystis radixulma]
MPAPHLAPPTDIVRRARDRLLARVPALGGEATTLRDAEDERDASTEITARPRVPEDQRYVLREPLASGGIGVIRRAEDVRLGRVIAVKELLRDSPDAQRRFALEAAITARLQHPGIVPLYDLGWRDTGEPFYCMKLVDGESLDAKIQRAPTLPQRLRLVEHVIAVADAIAYAHAQKVLHRDLKPANVLVGRFGETVVIDWGLAKDLARAGADEMSDETCSKEHGASDMTQAGTVLGTLRYMPPEQAAGEVVDVRSDVYALGAILYHVLAGQPPFAAATGTNLAAQVLAGGFTELRRIDPAIPAELATISQRAMACDPKERYPDAGAFAEDLRRFQAGRMVAAHSYSLAERARLWARTHRAVVVASGLAIAAAGVLTWQAIEQARVRAAERARTEEAEREASAQAEKAARSAFERQAIVDAQRLDASIVRAQVLTEEGDRIAEAQAIARAAATEALRTGGPVAAATRALAATLTAPRIVATVGEADGDYVDAAHWLADGAVIATHDKRERLRLWDTASGQRIAEVGRAFGFAVDPAGATLLTAGPDGLVRRDARTGAVTAELGDERRWLALAPDGQMVAAGVDGGVHVRDANTGALVARLPGEAQVAAFSRDHSRVVTGGNGYAWLWSLPGGELLGDLPTAMFGYTAVAISDDGTRVAVSGNDEDVYMWDLRGERPRLTKRAAGPAHAAERLMFSPDGTRLVSAIMNGSWFVWDTEDGRLIRRVDGEAGAFTAADLSRDGRWLAVGANDGTVRVWEVASGALRATLRAEHGEVMSVLFSPDGRRILSGTAAGPTSVWELPIAVPPRWRVAGMPSAMDIDIASDRLVVAEAGGVTVHRIVDGAAIASLRADGSAYSQVELSGQGTLFTATDEGFAQLWEADSGALRCSLPSRVELEQRPVFVVDSQALVTVDGDGAVQLWSTDDCRGVHTLHGPRLPYGDVRGTPDGHIVVPAALERLARIDPWSPEYAVLFSGMKSPIFHFAFAGDGSQVFAHGWRGDARSWDARTGETLAELTGNSAMILSAVFSPDDDTILTVDNGHSARLWSAADLSPMLRLEGRRNWAAAPVPVFSPDGTRVLVADLDGEVGLWDALDGAFVGGLARLHSGAPVALAFSADGADAIVVGAPLGAARLPATPEGILAASE